MSDGPDEPSLDELVTAVATRLMAVDSTTVIESSQQVVCELHAFFDVDVTFLRRNDHELGASVLVAEWPPRAAVPGEDPLGVVFFAQADPTFASADRLSEVLIVRPALETEEYQRRVHAGSGVLGVSSASVPLLSHGVTTGVLGFVKYGDRNWSPAEINALRAIASLLAQTQARVAAEERLIYLAYHDELTGLSNRRALLDQLALRLGAEDSGSVAVLFLDIDRLKVLNDFLGHATGDQFLQSVATRLQNYTRPGDVVARLGGDEFVIVFGSPTEPADIERMAVEIRDVLNEPVRLGNKEVSRQVSIGLAQVLPGDCTVSELLGYADQATFSAKALGGNGMVWFTEQMRIQGEVRSDIELHLREAIHTDALCLHYQPEIDLRTGRVLGVEALVRWNHPVRGLLQPDSFVGVAEATNLAGELGRWVLDDACRQLVRWQAESPELNFGVRVNISPAHLITMDFVARLSQALRDHHVDGRYLSLEITEHAVVSDLTSAIETLRRLADIGVGVAIDDFGTGYSSFAQLKSLPVTTLKIDRGFVEDLGDNPDDLAIVRSIVGLAESFGLELVAEGVATTRAAQLLLDLGCYRAQGYLISPPVPAERLEPVLRDGYIRPDTLGLPPYVYR